MNLLKTQRYLEHLDKLLIEESTGPAESLADKMGIGVRTLFLHFGAPSPFGHRDSLRPVSQNLLLHLRCSHCL